jgi:hypothetical protein
MRVTFTPDVPAERLKRRFVISAEKLRQEKMAVLVILVGADLKRSIRRAPRRHLTLARPLLRQHGRRIEFAERSWVLIPKRFCTPGIN